MAIFKNLPIEHPQTFANLITPKANQIVSMALTNSEHFQISVFTFADKETVSEEEYFGDTMYFVLEGETFITQGNRIHSLNSGDVLQIPAHTLHSIGGKGAFKVLQITVNE